MKIYAGNLAYEVTNDDLAQAFGTHGKVEKAEVVKDPYTHQSKGFGFVEMPDGGEARAAISALNGTDLKGRALNVSEARPRNDSKAGGARSSERSW